MKNLIMILCVVFITGCYPATEWVVSENNDPEFIEAAKKASEAWCEADKDSKPCLPFRITDKDEEANILYEVSEEKNMLAYTKREIFKSNLVVLRSMCPKISWSWTIAHEMGHASTDVRNHVKSKGVMSSNKIPYEERQVPIITQKDLDLVNGLIAPEEH